MSILFHREDNLYLNFNFYEDLKSFWADILLKLCRYFWKWFLVDIFSAPTSYYLMSITTMIKICCFVYYFCFTVQMIHKSKLFFPAIDICHGNR